MENVGFIIIGVILGQLTFMLWGEQILDWLERTWARLKTRWHRGFFGKDRDA